MCIYSGPRARIGMGAIVALEIIWPEPLEIARESW